MFVIWSFESKIRVCHLELLYLVLFVRLAINHLASAGHLLAIAVPRAPKSHPHAVVAQGAACRQQAS